MKFLADSTAELIRGGGTVDSSLFNVSPNTSIVLPQAASFQFNLNITPSVGVSTITQLNTASNLVVFGGIISNLKGIITSTQVNINP
jgi:hypothetical protein